VEYTAEELATLSDEERAALVDDEPSIDALKAIAGEEEEVTAEAVADDGKAEVAEEEAEFVTQYVVQAVEGYDDKMAAFKDQKADLRKQLNDGDLSLDDYDAKKDEIVAQEQELREQKLKADIAADQNEQNAVARWKWEQEKFFADESNAIYKDKLVMAAFDTAVRDLGNAEENANRNGAWFLNKANEMVRERFNMGKAVEVASPKETPQPKDSGRKPDLSVVPKTLSHLPSADVAKTGEVGEFDHLDRMSGLELERAVSRLSEAERERYRASA
jgi:hypothetical protein